VEKETVEDVLTFTMTDNQNKKTAILGCRLDEEFKPVYMMP